MVTKGTCLIRPQTFAACVLLLLQALLLPLRAPAAGGSYKIDFSAADPSSYERLLPSQITCPAGGVAADPINPPAGQGTDDARYGAPKDAVESLAPEDLALGQVVAFEIAIEVDGSTSPEGGKINLQGEWAAITTNNSLFGYDPAYAVLCAFVDTSDSGNVGLSGDEKVTTWSSTLVPNNINPTSFEGDVAVEGLDDGEVVVVEVWVVLQDSIPQNAGGNVHSALLSAETDDGDTINTGNQTVPLLKIKDFFDRTADIGVEKMDGPDPAEIGAQITYTIEVSNYSGDTVAQEASLSDTLDANTGFVSLNVTDSEGYLTTCSHAAGVITCELGFLNPLETVTITVIVEVLNSAAEGPGGDGPCTGSESLCNTVTVESINDEDSHNNIDSQPTGVDIPGPLAALLIKKTPNADIVYAGDTVEYGYEVTNGGGGAIVDVVVTDDKCAPVIFVSGDADNDGRLDPTETWLYSCSQALTETTKNIGTVTGTDACTETSLESSNCATVKVINPRIAVEKSADTPTTPTGGTVVYSYVVTIPPPGDDPLDNVIVTDDKCSPVTYTGGDTNLNGTLDLNESWSFSCSAVLTQDTTNTATASGEDSLNNKVTDTDEETVTIDDCPADAEKTTAGVCGCGAADTDSDGDQVADCVDECPNFAANASQCGCAAAPDSDRDGTPDCVDQCPADSAKIKPGLCGCGAAENSCLDCAGTVHGTLSVDECGVCGGDGKSCACVEVSNVKKWSKARQTIKVLRDRTEMFSKAATACGGKNSASLIKKANVLYRQAIDLLKEEFEKKTLICDASACTKTSLKASKVRLHQIVMRLTAASKTAKLTAIDDCDTPHKPGGKHKVTEDYRDDALEAVQNLPTEKTSC